MTFDRGDKLCSCTLLVKCGEGSYGEVWLAENAIGGKVALKIIRGKYSERELEGLRNYKDCDHPNLLKIRHIEINDDFVCYTMDAADDLNNGKGDYLPDTLANRLNKYGRLDGKEIMTMLENLLAGLEELHNHGLVHRDIKPDNILYINGRATLADAGLIASTGQHTLVGTPGFVSPRLLESGGVAETSDDFYALSKVVYCALTGLAPNEYPTIPQEMTISLDPKINRAILAGCSQDIKSSAEFRKVIAEKSKPVPQEQKTEPEATIVEDRKSSFPWIIAIIAVMLAAIAGFYLLSGRNTAATVNNELRNTEGTVPQQVADNNKKETVPEPEKSTGNSNVKNHETPSGNKKTIPEPKNSAVNDVDEKHETPSGASGTSGNTFPGPEPEIKRSAVAEFEARFAIAAAPELPDGKQEFLRDRKERLKPWFHRFGLLKGSYFQELLNHKVFTKESIAPQVDKLMDLRWGTPAYQQLNEFRGVLFYPSWQNPDVAKVRERQEFWKKQEGKPADVAYRMLTEDPIMQMVAVNWMLERFCRLVLEKYAFGGQLKENVEKLIDLQEDFTNPDFGVVKYMRRKEEKKQKP